MAPKESKDVVSLRELVRQHMEESSKSNTMILQELAEIKTHRSYTKEKLDNHDKSIEDLKKSDNKNKGAIWAFGIIGGIVSAITTIKVFLFGH